MFRKVKINNNDFKVSHFYFLFKFSHQKFELEQFICKSSFSFMLKRTELHIIVLRNIGDIATHNIDWASD